MALRRSSCRAATDRKGAHSDSRNGLRVLLPTVFDIVQFAKSQDILCQGRGPAANSAVCYCLEITEVDPARVNLLFERFISKERNEPPDIDVDFEHERREEVIQYIYKNMGAIEQPWPQPLSPTGPGAQFEMLAKLSVSTSNWLIIWPNPCPGGISEKSLRKDLPRPALTPAASSLISSESDRCDPGFSPAPVTACWRFRYLKRPVISTSAY